jgi:hypothetical protein
MGGILMERDKCVICCNEAEKAGDMILGIYCGEKQDKFVCHACVSEIVTRCGYIVDAFARKLLKNSN